MTPELNHAAEVMQRQCSSCLKDLHDRCYILNKALSIPGGLTPEEWRELQEGQPFCSRPTPIPAELHADTPDLFDGVPA